MSPSLLDSGLTYHRGLVKAALPDTATRSRPTKVDDGSGGSTDGAPDLSLQFPCRLYGQAKTPLEQPQAGRIVAIMEWQLAAPVGTDLVPKDQVILKGRTFEVIDLDEKRSSPALLWVNLREVR